MKNTTISGGEIIKQLSVYSLGNIAVAMVNVFLLPLYAKYLSIGEYGSYSLYETTAVFLISVLTLGIPHSLLRFGIEKKTANELGQTIFNCLLFLCIMFTVFITIMMVWKQPLSEMLYGKNALIINFQILTIYIVSEILNQIPFTLFRIQHRAITYSVLIIAKLIFTFGIILYCIIELRLGVQGVLLGMLGGSLIFLFGSFLSGVIKLHISVNFEEMKTLFYYGAPITLSIVSTVALYSIDRFILEYFRGSSEVGMYSLGSKLSGLISLFVISVFQVGFLPIAYRASVQYKNPQVFFSIVFKYYSIVLVVMGLSVIFFAPYILRLFTSANHDFWQSETVVPLLVIAEIFNGIQYFFLIGLRISKITKYDVFVMLPALAFNSIFNLILVPYYGYMGSGFSMAITFILISISFYFLSQKYYFIPYPFRKLLAVAALAVFFYLLTILISTNDFLFDFNLRLVLLIIFIIVLFFLKIIDKKDWISLAPIPDHEAEENS